MPTPLRHKALPNMFEVTRQDLTKNRVALSYETSDLHDLPGIEAGLSACRDCTLPDSQSGYEYLAQSGALRNVGESWYTRRGWEVILLETSFCNGIVSYWFMLAHWSTEHKSYDHALLLYTGGSNNIVCRGEVPSSRAERLASQAEFCEVLQANEEENLRMEGRHG